MLDHGPRISKREFERHITKLYEKTPSNLNREEQFSLMQKELDLIIDHRLGINFPIERREKLWRIRRKTESSIAKNILFLFSRSLLKFRTAGIADKLLKDYREVLSKKEFNAFFDIKKEK